MFGFGKKKNMKKEMRKLDELSAAVEKSLDASEEAVKNDESLYKWQKQKRLSKIQSTRFDAAIEIGNRRKAIKEKYK